jgi:hypothetical protein
VNGRLNTTLNVREEVLNVVLADLLSDRDLLSIPESIRSSISGRGRRLPDVTVADLWGVRIVIEGRIGDTDAIRDSLLRDASGRVEQGISPICLAVLYPPDLRRVSSLSTLKRKLARARLQVRVISEGNQGDWADATVDGLGDTLRRSYELLVRDDVVLTAVAELEASIDSASEILASVPATALRLRTLLGIPEETEEETADEED